MTGKLSVFPGLFFIGYLVLPRVGLGGGMVATGVPPPVLGGISRG